MTQRYSRREFLGVAAAGSGAVLAACDLSTTGPKLWTHAEAMIVARPGTPTLAKPVTGYSALGLSTIRDGLLYMPTTYQASTPAPLAVMLHGYGSSAQFWEDRAVGELADDLGMVILAPDSRYSSWDFLEAGIRGYGPDPQFINHALGWLFLRVNINPQRVAIGGFVDGGFESLGLGIANGDLFTHVIAHSPSGLLAPFIQGKPKVFVSVGDDDAATLDFTQVNVVDKLVNASYNTQFTTFDGGAATLPDAVSRQAFEWMLA